MGSSPEYVSYPDWVSKLQVKDIACCHGNTNALWWLYLFPEIDVVRIHEYVKDHEIEGNTCKSKIWRCADFLYVFYSPLPIKNVKIHYLQPPPNQIETHSTVNLEKVGDKYLFKTPLPLYLMPFGELSCEYTIEGKVSPLVPMTFITGYLANPKRLRSSKIFGPRKVILSEESSESLVLESIKDHIQVGVLNKERFLPFTPQDLPSGDVFYWVLKNDS